MKRYLFTYGELNAGGAERVLLDILNNFNYQENEVDLLQINAGGVLLDELPKEVNVIKAWNGYPPSYKFALRSSLWLGCQLPLRRRLKAALQGKHYDVGISFLEGMPLKCHSLITDVADRNYSWVHCDLNEFRYCSHLFRNNEELQAYNKMTAVISVSNDTSQAFLKRFPQCISQQKVIYNPIDHNKILRKAEEGRVTNNHFTIAICGRLTPPKKIERALRLARAMKDYGTDFKVQLIGTGELEGEMKELTTSLDINDVVEFVGFVRNPYPHIKAADMLLSTSCAEGFSLVICEAMVLGVPVVSTMTSGPMEILDNNRYGLLCCHDDDSIYNAVMELYNDAALRKHYAEVGRQRVLMFSIDNTLKEIYKL